MADAFPIRAILENGQEVMLASRAEVAGTFWARLRGLIGRPLRAGEGLLLRPCHAVHTCFMSYAIDVAFLDDEGCVLATAENLRPWRWRAVRGAAMALELPAGTLARARVAPGSRIPLPA